MSITKCVCAVMRIGKEAVLPQARAERVSRAAVWAEPLDAFLRPRSEGLAQSNLYSIPWSMSTKDQLLYSALHGTAMRYAAERRNLDESIEELRQLADGRNDILAEAAGITAGSWYAWPSTHVGYELIGAAMLILAGCGRGFPLDHDELERWTRVGYERGMRSRKGER
jgi:hypothetical protein